MELMLSPFRDHMYDHNVIVIYTHLLLADISCEYLKAFGAII